MKKRSRRWLSYLLALVMLSSMASPALAAEEPIIVDDPVVVTEEVVEEPEVVEDAVIEEDAVVLDEAVVEAVNPLALENVESIQAFTDATFYGTGVTRVEITYKDGVDVTGATLESYTLTDRGSLTSEYGNVDIAEVTVDGQVVTLTIQLDYDATEINQEVYTGSNATGSRQRDSYGVYVTGAWYRDGAGQIIKGNAGQMGYQARECLELRLQVAGSDTMACLADDLGKYDSTGLWLPTVDLQFTEGGFQDLTDLKLSSTAFTADWTQVTAPEGKHYSLAGAKDRYIRGYYYVPENYDPAKGIVFILQGQGISYWKTADGADNAGTGFMFDPSGTSWSNKGAIVVNIHDRSSQQELASGYDFVEDDARVMKYFIDTYGITGNIVVQGNSRGTMACDMVIKALAGCPYYPGQQKAGWAYNPDKDVEHSLDKSVYDFTVDTFVCQNGFLGGSMWTAEEEAAVAATGLRVWCIDGEQDTNNITPIESYSAAVEAAGYSEEWIEENVRLTGLTSNLFYPWGETDHSVTRINGYYFADEAYYGPDLHLENGEIVYDTRLAVGDTYTLLCRGKAADANKVDYEYTVYGESFQNWALEDADAVFTARDLASVPVPTYSSTTDPNQLPLTGYYKMNVSEGREVRVYIPETAILRPYFHFIAVPSNVNVDEFIVSTGWKQLADETGECLYVLVPDQTTMQWGTVEDEVAYITAAKAKHGGNGGYFTTFGEFYLTGYGDGAEMLEAWAAINPNLVIAQTYIDGDSEGEEALAVSGEEFFGYKHMTDGDIRDRDKDGVNERVNADGTQKILYQFTERLKSVLNKDAGENAGLLKKSDLVVPTILVNSEADNAAYWQKVNKAEDADASEAINELQGIALRSGVEYYETEITWSTEYAGNISKVITCDTDADTRAYAFTRAIRDEMAYYTRYDNTVAYGNGLMLRLDYTEAQHERYTSAEKYGETEVSGQTLDGEEVAGTVNIRELIASDGYYSDLLMYVPETAPEENIPVIIVWHGGSQNGHLFMDSTSWWQTAAKEGFAIVFPTRTYKVTDASHDETLFDATRKVLEEDGRFDLSRVYVTGQSMGGIASTTNEMYRSQYIAAGVATNAGNVNPAWEMPNGIPVGLVIGEGNYALRGIPGYVADTSYEEDATSDKVRSTEAAEAGADIYWDDTMARMETWESFFEKANGLTKENIRETVLYRGASVLNGGTNGEFSLSAWNTNNARLRTWYWDNAAGIPIMMYTMAMYQAHNCQPSYRPIIWDFVKHYSAELAEDGTLVRYYSESGFALDDAVVIEDTASQLQNKVVSAQATVESNFYGHKVSKVVVTFAEDVTEAMLEAAEINVYDRGSHNPNFGTLNVAETEINGNVVTLTIDMGTDKTSDRSRNSFGVMNTNGWYKDSEGNIYYGKEAGYDNLGNPTYPNVANKTCQGRELELILTVNNELADGIFSFGDDASEVWAETEIISGLEKVETEYLDIADPKNAPAYSQVDGKVPVQVIWPEGYDVNRAEKYPVVVYQCGGGVCYWELAAGQSGSIAAANNLGCNAQFDSMMTTWAQEYPEAVVMSVNVHSTNTAESAKEIDDAIRYAQANWNVGKAILVGNSQGTIIGSDAIRQAPELFAGFVECNGNFGKNVSTVDKLDGTVANSSFCDWTAEEVKALIDNEVSCWMFNGETDGANPGVAQDTYRVLKSLYTKAGKSEQWIYDHVHVSGLQSWQFKAYGETDHSVTKVVADKYVANPYNDPNNDGKTLNVGDTYKFTGKEAYANYDFTMNFTYTVYAESVAQWAKNLWDGAYDVAIVSLDETEVPALDNSQPNRLPMTGYFSKKIGEDRTMKVYLAEGIHVRDNYTIIAVPDGVNTESFLAANGWFATADARHEGLIVLEPGKDGWGTAAEEAAYVNAAIGFYSGNDYFSVFGENYLVGYGAGAPALEYWAAANPLKVIAQVYVESEGLDEAYLEATGAKVFPTKNGSYLNVEFPEGFELLTYKDAVVPTWYVGSAPAASVSYWKEANDTVSKAATDAVLGKVYAQRADSDNWTTDYSGPISKVAVNKNGTATVADITAFMYYYTRYENGFVYGNQLSVRATFEDVDFYTVEVNGHPREYSVYAPASLQANAPVVMVWPGNTQTDRVFEDATQWKQVADANGFLLVTMCEDYNNATTVTHKDSAEFYTAAVAKIKADYAGKIDETRIYGTGQSLGSMTTQGFCATNPEFYAAVASTSGPIMNIPEDTWAGKPVPTYLIYGAGDLTFLEGTIWDDTANMLDDWAKCMLAANGFALTDVSEADGVNLALDQFGHKNLTVWTWTKNFSGVEIPMVQLAKNLVRSHNCISAEMPLLYDYMKHFSMDAKGNRYYSASAFEKDDAVCVYGAQKITTKVKATVKKVDGNKAFALGAKTTGDGKLTYKSSNTKVVTVSAAGKVTVKGPGVAKITITAAATKNFTKATKTVTIKVAPKKMTIAKVAGASKAVKVTVKKYALATGYQLQVSTSKKFTKSATKTVDVKKSTTLITTVKKLKAGKTYYVRARAYKTVGKTKLYGAYSAVKSAKTK